MKSENKIKSTITDLDNIGLNIEMDKLQMFDGTVRKVSGFLIVCQLYIRMKIRDILVKKVGAVDTIIYIRRTNRYVGEYNGELRKWQFDICNSRKFFH